MDITVLGGGAWGTAIAASLSADHAVRLWARDRALIAQLRRSRCNERYLPGIELPDGLRYDDELEPALRAAQLIVVATPVGGLRDTLRAVCTVVSARNEVDTPSLLWLCKGFERGTALLPHQVAQLELPSQLPFGALSGPSFAQDVARALPAAVTLASADGDTALRLAGILNGKRLRIYSSDDLVGVEVGGAVKNVIAIAAGISDGLGLGASARAALITRGLAEITRLGVGMGGQVETFLGLAGVGDLMLTCTTDLSRNRQVGLALARGESLDQILGRLGHVAEGVLTAREAQRLGRRLAVDTPIVDAVCDLLDGRATPSSAVSELMRREPRPDRPFYDQ